jgi:hypothetical protein
MVAARYAVGMPASISTPDAAAPKAKLCDYGAAEVEAIVAQRCGELSALIGLPLVAPAVRVVEPVALAAARDADVRVRAEKVRGRPHQGAVWTTIATWLAQTFGPACLGYFAASDATLFLNGELVPQQAAYVLLHELTHAVQWQNFPALFAAVDASRVAAEDLAEANADGAAAARDRYESLVTFVEGHATMFGRRALRARIQRDSPTSTPDQVDDYVRQMMALDLHDDTTALIYVRGEITLASMEPARVASLLGDPEGIVKLFTRRPPG